MLEIAPKRTMDHATILEETTSSMIKEGEMTKGMITMEDVKEEEMLQVIMKKIVIHKRCQDSPGMKLMLRINLNIFLFLPLLGHLLWIHGTIGWLIVGPVTAQTSRGPKGYC